MTDPRLIRFASLRLNLPNLWVWLSICQLGLLLGTHHLHGAMGDPPMKEHYGQAKHLAQELTQGHPNSHSFAQTLGQHASPRASNRTLIPTLLLLSTNTGATLNVCVSSGAPSS